MTGLRAVAAAAAIATAVLAPACRHAQPAAPPAEGASLAGEPARGPRYALYPLVRPTGSAPVPARFADAEADCARARAAYDERQAYTEAAELFMHAADTLALPADQPYAEAFAANRVLVYGNAAAAWAMASAPAEARRRLEPRLAIDPACARGACDFIRPFLGTSPPAPAAR